MDSSILATIKVVTILNGLLLLNLEMKSLFKLTKRITNLV